MKALNLTGQVFGRLTAACQLESTSRGKTRWLCDCSCGGVVAVLTTNLRSGVSTSCGCARRETLSALNKQTATHGMTGTPTYRSWQAMIGRCTYPSMPGYERYGGAGVTVCAPWRESFENFLADMGERPEGKTLDRIKNELGYSPDNCRWATPHEQALNRRPKGHAKVERDMFLEISP